MTGARSERVSEVDAGLGSKQEVVADAAAPSGAKQQGQGTIICEHGTCLVSLTSIANIRGFQRGEV